jgi:hypothetical protein
LAGRPPKCANFPLLFGIAQFLPLHHSVSEDFVTWCSKAHQVRYKKFSSNFQFCRIKNKEPLLLFWNEKGQKLQQLRPNVLNYFQTSLSYWDTPVVTVVTIALYNASLCTLEA